MRGTDRRATAKRVIAERMSLNRQPVDPAASYRVTVNNSCSSAATVSPVLTQGTAPQVGTLRRRRAACLFWGEQPGRPDRRRSHCQGQLSLTP